MKTCKCGRAFEPQKRQGINISKFCFQCQRRKAKEKKEKVKLKKKEKRENNIPRLKREADKLFSVAIRLRDKRCRRTGSTENLQCSHIWSRSNLFIRWDLDNAFTLTAGQHLFWWHKEIVESVDWAKQELGEEKWKELQNKKNMTFKLTAEFIKERIRFLKDYIAELS